MDEKVYKEKKMKAAVIAIVFMAFSGCNTAGPIPVKLNSDKCESCGMKISDPKFPAELITAKGRVYKFDDMICMLNFRKANSEKTANAEFYISTFLGDHQFISAPQAYYIQGKQIQSPMRGAVAAFNNKDSAAVYAGRYEAKLINWSQLNP